MSASTLINRIHELDVVGIRTEGFPEYLKMWVVEVDGRLFARSWTTNRDSWFWAFIEVGECLMLVDNVVYRMSASKAASSEDLHHRINLAYESRYGSGEAAVIAEAMQSRSRWPMTVEFLPNPEDA